HYENEILVWDPIMGLRLIPRKLNAANSIAFRVLFKASQASDVGSIPSPLLSAIQQHASTKARNFVGVATAASFCAGPQVACNIGDPRRHALGSRPSVRSKT